MSAKNSLLKTGLVQMGLGLVMWLFFLRPVKKKGQLIVGDYEPVQLEYQPVFFKDKEYFGENSIPYDFYNNWLKLAIQLDKIRVAFGSPILIKKGFTIREEKYNSCSAVEIFPQNNNHQWLSQVVSTISKELDFVVLEKMPNNNVYLEI